MIRAVIIDDEKNNIENIVHLLKKHELPVTVVGTATNADDGVSLITASHPDLLFLDIQMPDKNGFEVLKAVPHYQFEVVFVTAFDNYGIQAVKFSAIDYLLKPIDPEELKASVSKVGAKLMQKKANLQLENLMEFIKDKDAKKEHKLALSSTKEIRFVHTGDIIRCESSNAYTQFFLSDGTNIMVSKPIFEYEELLSSYDFIRCHQSHLVNIKFIKSLLKEDSGYLLMDDNTRIPISRNKKENVIKRLHTIKK
ncbi:LytR/AlgR family response regulator transcription factor [Mucilaginibacter ginsenosidivorax]|uniref:Response regulator transcription factor n=1 Tax=Mucilaginibacter ginsenosidivorax TaxID=862126 RepID=A0A5B8VUX7_9SPHI|nr:LytTR family DNA-binding domain-containing protein [Mucilaginibacter ginsenosidivorax]QEC75063.1 response regulator transcription factor [Mucilaginibacter ginsenosidivorax]